MHEVFFDDQRKALFLYFYEKIEGAEVDDTLLKWAKRVGPETARSVEFVVMDLRAVTEADLFDSDRARVAHWQAQIATAMGFTTAEFAEYRIGLKLTRLVDPMNGAGKIGRAHV